MISCSFEYFHLRRTERSAAHLDEVQARFCLYSDKSKTIHNYRLTVCVLYQVIIDEPNIMLYIWFNTMGPKLIWTLLVDDIFGSV